MKTLFTKSESKKFNNFSFDVLTSVELSLIKGGKDIDIFIDPAPRMITTLSITPLTLEPEETKITKKDTL